MKTLKNLDVKPNLLEENLPEDLLIKIPTFRQYLKGLISQTVTKSPDESLDLYQAGLKLMATGDVDLEDAQFRIIEAKVTENPMGWPAIIHAQIYNKLKESK